MGDYPIRHSRVDHANRNRRLPSSDIRQGNMPGKYDQRFILLHGFKICGGRQEMATVVLRPWIRSCCITINVGKLIGESEFGRFPWVRAIPRHTQLPQGMSVDSSWFTLVCGKN